MAAIASSISFFLLVSLARGRAEAISGTRIILGATLSPNSTNYPSSWFSPSERFAFGFYPQGNSFRVGIWLIDDTNKIIVWTADRDGPLLLSNSTLLVLTKKGELSLQTGKGQTKLIPNTNGTASSAFMQDSGNFVLCDKNSDIIWQSFNYPTDTLLGGQILHTGSQLISSSSDTDHSSGKYELDMQEDGNLAFYERYSGGTAWDASWASNTGFGPSFKYYLLLNDTGPLPLCIVNASSSEKEIIWNTGDYGFSSENNFTGNKIIYRATAHPYGVLQLYAHFVDNNGKYRVKILWSSNLDNICNMKGVCGFNSYCTMARNQFYCNCLPGTDFIDPLHDKLGCKRNFSEAVCRGGKDNATLYSIIPIMRNMTIDVPPYLEEEIPEEECPSSCLQDCYCGAALYENGRCRKLTLPLRNIRRGTSTSSAIYLKVGNQNLIKSNNDPPNKTTSKKAIVLIILVILGFAILLCFVIAISSCLIYKIGVLRYKRLLETADWGLKGVTLRVFSYNELKKATNGFKQKLGKGSFGSVYKGNLHKGRKVIAVKKLEKLVEDGEREFKAEMQAIGKTHHRNLVRLLGYCAEGSKRLLVYEYMKNGSLEKFIFSNSIIRPNWDQRRRIALDIARGLLYLHEECKSPIIHCDIKPPNILMDKFWTAKISDFGLAKLLKPDQTRTFTDKRGTRGYVAPEWDKNIPITVKADVYSYGIMLLEIAFCRRSLAVNLLNPEQTVLSIWVYRCFVGRELNKLVLGEEVDQTLLENMVKVGLWCIQDEPFLRPSMKSVVLMLEGVTDVAVPPCPSANYM